MAAIAVHDVDAPRFVRTRPVVVGRVDPARQPGPRLNLIRTARLYVDVAAADFYVEGPSARERDGVLKVIRAPVPRRRDRSRKARRDQECDDAREAPPASAVTAAASHWRRRPGLLVLRHRAGCVWGRRHCLFFAPPAPHDDAASCWGRGCILYGRASQVYCYRGSIALGCVLGHLSPRQRVVNAGCAQVTRSTSSNCGWSNLCKAGRTMIGRHAMCAFVSTIIFKAPSPVNGPTSPFLLQLAARELRQHERRRVHVRVVVPQ